MVEDRFSNSAWFERATKSMPGGVSSPVRSFRSVGGTPYIVEHGKGAYVYDVEGKRYLDYVQSYGASILGHADDDVVRATQEALAMGTTFGASTKPEIELAEEIVKRVQGVDLVRFVSSGTEAVMTAVRVARAATHRKKVVVFEGCYHGHSDGLLATGGSGIATFGMPSTLGVTPEAVKETLVLPYNTVPTIDADVACVVVEPVAANMGVVLPNDGWLMSLKKSCDLVGALLIFDEVITGFRLSRGGASSYFGIQPDLWCFGKIIGGGFPLAALAGRNDLMELLAPAGPVYQAGTLSGNPIAATAGLKVLEKLDDKFYVDLTKKASLLKEGLESGIGQRGIAVRVPQVGPLLGIFFSDTPVTNFIQAKESCDTGRYKQFFNLLLKEKVALAPGPYEAMFLTSSHSDHDIAKTIESADSAASKMAHLEAKQW